MKIWITKFVLTEGIIEADGEISSINKRIIKVWRNGGYMGLFHGEGREWHTTQKSAQEKAESMRWAKIVSLQKQIARLKELSFETVDKLVKTVEP